MVKEMEDNKLIRGNCLKFGKAFIDAFMKTAMPIMDEFFSLESASVNELLQMLQKSTRLLQIMCGHSKADEKDTSLIAKIPMLRKTLETLVFRVKAMLDRNGCANAFWIGNLKHKSIKGVELSSQMPIPEPSSVAKDPAKAKKRRKVETNNNNSKEPSHAVSQVSRYSSSSDDSDDSESDDQNQKQKRTLLKNSDSETSVYDKMFGSDSSDEEDQVPPRKRDLSTVIDEGPIVDEGPSIYMEEDSNFLSP